MAKFPANARTFRNFAVIVLTSIVVGLPIISQPLGLMTGWNDTVSTPTDIEIQSEVTEQVTQPGYAGTAEDYSDSSFNRGVSEYAIDPYELDLSGQIRPENEEDQDPEETAAPAETQDPGDLSQPLETSEAPSLQFVFEEASYTGFVATGSLNVRARPATESAAIAKLSLNDTLQVTGTGDGWTRVIYNSQTAYVYSKYLSSSMIFEQVSQTVYVTSSTLNLRNEPSTDSTSITKLSKNTKLTRIGIGDGWSKVKTSSGKVGYVSSQYLTRTAPYTPTSAPAASSSTASSSSGRTYSGSIGTVVDAAYRALGVEYVSGGSSMSGFDCSGFTSWVYRQAGITISRSASTYLSVGTSVPYSQIQPGDIVCIDHRADGVTSVTHVGIYVGNGIMIHASSSHDAVVKRGVDDYMRSNPKYILVSIRRVITG